MDNSNPEREPKSESMSQIFDLMVNDARQSFFQLENLVSCLDSKAFGVVTLDSVLLSIFAYIIVLYKSHILYIPYSILILSVLFMSFCIRPRKWKRGRSLITIKKYGNLEFEAAANTMAMNYARWEDKLYIMYNKKLRFFKIGLDFLGLSVLLEIIILAYLIFDP